MWTAKLVVVVVAALVAAASAQFGGTDPGGLLNDPAALTQIIQCLLANSDSGCSLQGRLLKSVLPQLLQSNCAQCSEAQRQDVANVLRHLVNERPEEWQRLAAKYDPAGTLRTQHGDEWRARGVNM
ncbi:ejaculatory bulb-specific protein 3-like [Schistocerca gregaria]|uniref:ejaculatory bulb-specific protein 3-like n=1 Tax=Schistocerca gregaria TaxID=7010 RepID=UPI00211E5C9F|nr:ejaculatory bulb-specific protein 3-like [Schistocerca gregaria]